MKNRTLSGAVLLISLSALPACPSGGGTASDTAAAKPSASASASAAASARANASASASASAAAPAASAGPGGVVVSIPVDPERVAKVVNPLGEAPYSGPTGTLKGTVRIEGDRPPDTAFKIPAKCNEAAATYGKLFRVGFGSTLGDVLVAVTGYQGYVPPRTNAARVTIYGCALAKRTMALTFGQHIEVSNLDAVDPYMPYLDSSPSKASIVAVPKGDPVKLYPVEPGHYMIRDQLPNDFMRADVYVLAYSTHDVTKLDGKYEIKGIPVGPVAVNAMLPAIDRTAASMINIQPGDNVVDFTLRYDQKATKPAAPKGGAKAPPAKSP